MHPRLTRDICLGSSHRPQKRARLEEHSSDVQNSDLKQPSNFENKLRDISGHLHSHSTSQEIKNIIRITGVPLLESVNDIQRVHKGNILSPKAEISTTTSSNDSAPLESLALSHILHPSQEVSYHSSTAAQPLNPTGISYEQSGGSSMITRACDALDISISTYQHL
jgi:hypothetical protein